MINRMSPKAGLLRLLATLAAVGLPFALAACGNTTAGTAPTAAQVATTAAADAAALNNDVAVAVNLYQIAKGIALVAAPANPALLADIAAADAIVAQISAVNTAATGAQPLVQGLVAQLIASANTITAKAAPAVTVVPKGSVPAKS